MACIRTHLISSASLASFPGPKTGRGYSGYSECWAGPVNEARVVSRDYLSSCTSSTPCFLFCPGLTQPVFFLLCCFNSAERGHHRSILRFSFRLLRCLRSPSRVTSRTRLCHIDDPRSFTSKTSLSTTP